MQPVLNRAFLPLLEEEARNLEALKKAYAEMILNTAQEAAARVAESQLKALRFQQVLSSTKDEALRLLLRFNRMIDAKTTKASFESLDKQRKIDELEAQVSEAEEMILNLRAELKQVQDQLEKTKCSRVQTIRGATGKENRPIKNVMQVQKSFDPITSESISSDATPEAISNSDMSGSALNRINLDDKSCNLARQKVASNSGFHDHIVKKPGMTSLHVKGQESQPCSNRSAQRIRTILRNLLEENLPFGAPVIKEGNHCLSIPPLPSSKTENMVALKEPEGSVTCINGKDVNNQSIKVTKTGRTKYRYGKGKATSCRLYHSQSIERHQLTSVCSCCKRYSYDDKAGGLYALPFKEDENVDAVEDHSDLGESTKYISDQHFHTDHKILGRRKFKSLDDLAALCTSHCQPHSSLSLCKASSLISGANASKVHLNPEHVKLTELNLGGVKTSEATNEASSQSHNKRLPKCTLIRRRKKECMSNPDENSTPSSMKRRAVGEQNTAPDIQKISFAGKGSDNLQLMQVAHQASGEFTSIGSNSTHNYVN